MITSYQSIGLGPSLAYTTSVAGWLGLIPVATTAPHNTCYSVCVDENALLYTSWLNAIDHALVRLPCAAYRPWLDDDTMMQEDSGVSTRTRIIE